MRINWRIKKVLKEELGDQPEKMKEVLDLLKIYAKECNCSSSLVNRLLNNFHTRILGGGWVWDYCLNGKHDESGILKNGVKVSYSKVYCPDVIRAMTTAPIPPDFYYDPRGRRRNERFYFKIQLINLRIYCRLLAMGYEQDDLNK